MRSSPQLRVEVSTRKLKTCGSPSLGGGGATKERGGSAWKRGVLGMKVGSLCISVGYGEPSFTCRPADIHVNEARGPSLIG
jgi:hypothetical protein